jgi:hypothetical protein
MALILLKSKYTRMVFLPEGGAEYREQIWEFNTDTLAVDYSMEEQLVYTTPPPNYSRATTERVHYTCEGTTETGYYHDGAGDVYTQFAPNSTFCGYTPPDPEPDPEPVVVLGCTDPYALNYNPNATPGNADENVCTYQEGVLSEIKVIEVRACGQGVYLQWYNNLGGVDGWLFQGKVDTLFTSAATGTFTYGDGLAGAAGKHLHPAVVLHTHELDENRFQAICQVFSSPLAWLVREDGTQQKVYVEPVSDIGSRAIGQSAYSLQVRVSLPPLNALKN